MATALHPTQSKAAQRVDAFRQRFGDGHFYLACHAALPLALTPDLLYSLWANFQRDRYGVLLDMPWIAVADLLLSGLCEVVGLDLYEMEGAIRDELMRQLEQHPRLGQPRVRELAEFVMDYVGQQLDSPDLDTRDFAQAQKWRTVAYLNPADAAREIAVVLTQLNLDDYTEWIRMASLLETLTEPLAEYSSLLKYAAAMSDFVRGKKAEAAAKFQQILGTANQLQVAGVDLPVPVKPTLPHPTIPKPDWTPLIEFLRQHYRWLVSGAVATSLGGIAVALYIVQTQNSPAFNIAVLPTLSLPSLPFLPSPSPSPSSSTTPSLPPTSSPTKQTNSASVARPSSSQSVSGSDRPLPPATDSPDTSNSASTSTTGNPSNPSTVTPTPTPTNPATARDIWDLSVRSVVKIIARTPDERLSYGTGFVIKRQGDKAWIVCPNFAVYWKGIQQQLVDLEVELYSGNTLDGAYGKRLGKDKVRLVNMTDKPYLALLEVTGLPSDIQPLPIRKQLSKAGSLGSRVYVIGVVNNSWQIAYSLIARISNNGSESNLLLEGLSLGPGSAGGPVIDDQNQVVGMILGISTIGKNDVPFGYSSDVLTTQLASWGIQLP